MPPAFPVLRMTDLPALIFFCLSAGKTRCITDFPSATIETQESSLAITCTKNALGFTPGGGSADTAASDEVGRGGGWKAIASPSAGFVTGFERTGFAGFCGSLTGRVNGRGL